MNCNIQKCVLQTKLPYKLAHTHASKHVRIYTHGTLLSLCVHVCVTVCAYVCAHVIETDRQCVCAGVEI
jgi:hypothetical protein